MKSTRSLMTALVGLAMLATPISASAYDYNYNHGNSHAARVARSVSASAHPFATGRALGHDGIAARDWRADNRGWGDAAAYRAYGRPGYVAGPRYVAAPAYGVAAPYYGGGGGGGGCGRAQQIMNTYYRDRNTGHPAAAYDVLAQNRWAFRNGCAGGGAPVSSGMLGGLGGFGGFGGGAPVSNYRPAYNGGGYNGGGYGQPYGGSGTSMLAPLLQYIR
jgi:hypothetical protein